MLKPSALRCGQPGALPLQLAAKRVRLCGRAPKLRNGVMRPVASAAGDAGVAGPGWGGEAASGGGGAPKRSPPSPVTAAVAGKVKDLKRRLRLAERRLEEEQERAAALQPYRVAAPKAGVMGTSRYAQTLRRAIVQASRDKARRPVVILGEPGLEKDNLAALVHFGSPCHAAPFVRLDCDRLDEDASELFGAGKKKGLLYHLPPEGTLLLNNIHKAPKAVLPLLKQTVYTASWGSMDSDGDDDEEVEQSKYGIFPRIIMTAEQPLPLFSELCNVIKVPPLRVRPADIRALQAFFLKRIAKQRDVADIFLTDEAVRALESYTYPLNIVELQTMVERAVAQSAASGNAVTDDVFWFARQSKDQLRYNLLKIPMVKRLLRSSLWPADINRVTAWVYVALVVLLFVGPQDRDHNFGLNLFWCYWWPASFIVYPFLGRVWCAVCPFMIWGEIVQNWRLSRGAQLLKWPRELMEQWGAWFLFGLFAGILVWEEVWDLPQSAALSSWLLLIITFGAMIGSWHFERRIWCRYLCPIGGMNGLFAKLSMTELRASQGVCSSTCNTYHCYKGGPEEPPEGLETNGCPVYSHPAQLVDNRNCVLCMECLKACPHKSIELRFRLPGVDLWTTHKPMGAEVCLMFMLLGAVYLHDVDDILMQLGLNPDPFLGAQLPHILTSAAFLALPGLIAWGVDAGWRLATDPSFQPMQQLVPALSSAAAGVGSSTSGGSSSAKAVAAAVAAKESQARAIALLRRSAESLDDSATATAAGASATAAAAASAAAAAIGAPPPLGQAPLSQMPSSQLRPFVALAYGYLPLVWAGTLAYYLDNAFEEAGLILPVTAATFGLEGWAGGVLPTFVVDPVVTEFLQGTTLFFGAGLSLVLTRKLGARPWAQLAPQCLLIVLFTAELWSLIIPN